MDLPLTLEKLGIALALGLLVGLQRERVHTRTAGIRTFALIAVLGAVSALLAQEFGGWVLAAGFVALAALLVLVNVANWKKQETDVGITTEVAVLLMYGIGAYVVIGHNAVAVILGGGVALLLHFKAPMHTFVARIGEQDITAIMRFVLIALVILPALPDEEFGPYQVLNPYKIWLMVVLIVGINLAGYVCSKLFGQQTGALLAGIFGGLVSSTATTFSFARQTREAPEIAPVAALVVLLASTVMYVRMMVEISVVARGAFLELATPLGVMLLWMSVICAGMYWRVRREKVEGTAPTNPAELVPALVFAGLYAVVLLAIAAAQDYFGDAGLYVVGFFSGLHDVDAITLSTAGYVEQGSIEASLGWRVALWASLVNLVMKGVYAFALGGSAFLRALLLPFGAALAGGVVLMLLWP